MTSIPSLACECLLSATAPGHSCASYVKAHVRLYGAHVVRFQLGSKDVNPCETQTVVSGPLARWIKNLPHDQPSNAGSGTMYARAQMRVVGKPTSVRVQVPGPIYNRTYGAAFTVKNAQLAQWLVDFGPPVNIKVCIPGTPAPWKEKFGIPYKAHQVSPPIDCEVCGQKWGKHYTKIVPGSEPIAICPCPTCGNNPNGVWCKCVKEASK